MSLDNEIKRLGDIMEDIGFNRGRYTTDDNLVKLNKHLTQYEETFIASGLNTHEMINYETTYKLYDLISYNLHKSNEHKSFYKTFVDVEPNISKMRVIKNYKNGK